MKKTLAILICALMIISPVTHAEVTATADDATVLNSIYEKDSVPLGYIGTAVVFKDDVNAVVYDQTKYKYENVSNGYPYTTQNGTFMIPADLFGKAFSVDVAVSGDNVSIGYNTIAVIGDTAASVSGKKILLDNPVEHKDDVIYLPVRSFAQDILGKSYLLDRGMHIFSDSKFPYENAAASAEINEPIDSIYRFMQFERKSATEIYGMMNTYMGGNEHPRLLTNKANLEIIKENSSTNRIVAKALINTIADADEHLAADLQEYDIPDGIRLLVAARNVMERLVTLSAAYLMTNDTKYAARAWVELENCLSWPDWNTSKHYLDNSELLYGVAVAFDSLYGYLNDTQKNFIMDKTYELSLQHSVAAFGGDYSGSEWRTATGNWGMVCNGGIVAACLAFGLEDNTKYQTYYNFLLENALRGIEYPIMLFFPDGAWSEGLSYWDYTVKYLCSGILAPLYFSTGTTLDFIEPVGVKETLLSTLYLQNDNYSFNYGDTGSAGKVSSESAYVIPLILGDDALMQTWNDEMLGMNADMSARTLMWYRPTCDSVEDDAELPYDRYFLSCSAGSMREQWNNPEASCVFIKGGRNNTNHSHLDLGTFCFDTMSERWAVELGKDSYNIEGGYWDLDGWELYAKRPEGQNCVVINPRKDITGEYYGGQYLNAYAPITQMLGKDKAAYATIDLSDAYKYDTSSYTRGFYLGDDRRTLTIQDEIALLESNSDIYWFMHTRAGIELDNDKKGATLTLNDKKLRVDVLTNASDYKLVINKVGEQRFPTDPVREGQLVGANFTSINVLTVEAKGSGNVYITVKLTPMDSDYDTYAKVSYTPISQWSIPDGERDITSAPIAKECDITSTLSFDTSSDADLFTITAQGSVTEVNQEIETVAGDRALSFYYTVPDEDIDVSNGRQKTFFAIHKLSEKKTDRIVVEHDLYMTDARATLNYELNDTTEKTKLTFYPLQDSSLFENGQIGSKYRDYSNDWHTVRLVLDFQKGCTEVYFDNELIDTSNCLLTGNIAGSGECVTSFQAIRINYSPSTELTPGQENFGFAIDNWRVYQELPLPEIKSVRAYDNSGNSAALTQTSVVSAEAADKFEIALSNTEYINKASLEANAKVLANGAEVPAAVSLSDGTLTIEVSDVPAHADLELVIGKDTLLYDGTTTIGADTVFNLKTANQNGLYIKRAVATAGEALRVDCDFDIVFGSKNVVAIFASYNDDDELVGITNAAVTLTGTKSLSMTLPKSNATKVKLFVWDGLTSSVTPYEKELMHTFPSNN